eukprot:8891508-Pyramimonas_sp.AAC.1
MKEKETRGGATGLLLYASEHPRERDEPKDNVEFMKIRAAQFSALAPEIQDRFRVRAAKLRAETRNRRRVVPEDKTLRDGAVATEHDAQWGVGALDMPLCPGRFVRQVRANAARRQGRDDLENEE